MGPRDATLRPPNQGRKRGRLRETRRAGRRHPWAACRASGTVPLCGRLRGALGEHLEAIRRLDPGHPEIRSTSSDGNPDIRLWRQQWRADIGSTYPGSAQLAKRILSDWGSYAIRAFEIVEEHAAGLRGGLGAEAVLTRSATPADWDGWIPDLLLVDPPGLRSEQHPAFPTLGSLLALTESVSNALIWLPIQTRLGRAVLSFPCRPAPLGPGPTAPPRASGYSRSGGEPEMPWPAA